MATLIALPLLAGCGQDDNTPARAGDEASPTPTLPRGADPVELDPDDFTAGSDNPYFPLEPGRQWTFRETDESGASVDVVVTVTNQTRKIANGVEARVVRDTVTEDGELVEDTLDWYAQDAEATSGTSGRTPRSSRTASSPAGKVPSRQASTARCRGS